jgi:hypothetical protein
MTREPLHQDWEVLGLEPGASTGQVRRAYQQRLALYAPDSVSTYSLLEEHERDEMLTRIENAYQRITGGQAPAGALPPALQEELPEPPSGPPPPYEEQPGAHLRHLRLGKSMAINQVADEIKVRATLLRSLEDEEYRHLPAAVYVRGFVVQYARVLGIANPEAVAAAYLSRMDAADRDR